MKKSLVILFAITLFFLAVVIGIVIGRNTGGTVISIDISGNDTDDDVGKVNINTATIDQLTMLPGIGRSKAESIIDYREENGFFETIDDLSKVKGITEKMVEALMKYITVGG